MLSQDLELYTPCLTVKTLKIKGDDVMKLLDIQPSAQVGKVLSHLLELVLNETLNNEYDELSNYVINHKNELLGI